MNQKTDCLKTCKQITTKTHKIPSNQTTQQQPSTRKFGEVIISQDRGGNMYKLEKLCK